MFHAASVPEDESREWLEVHNAPGTGPADLSGWQFTKGVSYTLPQGTVLAEGASLIVAANVASFQTAYPSYAGAVVGGWTGNLSSKGETIQLDNALGEKADEVEYADEGDWALRARPAMDPYGFQGWVWESAADGGGRSLERKSLRAPGKAGQSWQVSSAPGGTPGMPAPEVNLIVLSDVRHEPVIPRSTQPITVSARVRDVINGTMIPTQTLFWRRDGQTAFTAVPMTRAWADPGVPGFWTDEVFTATIPAQPNNTILEYYVSVTGDLDDQATWPAPARTTAPGVVPPVMAQAANALLQVDNTFNAATAWTPGARPVYRVIMTAVEREQLRTIQTTSGRQESDAAMNATFISQDGGGVELRHNTAVRNRGFGSRLGPPNNFHVSFPSDVLWKDREALQLNCRYPHSQVLASNVFALGGIAEQQARPVRLIMNGVSIAETGTRMFGSYARIETLNGDWVDRHYPDDPDGNLYRVDDHEPNPVGGIPGDLGSGEFRYEGTNPLAYADTFQKRTNEDLNDWSDLIQLCRVISAPATGGTAAQPAISDADYPQRVRELINVEQWFTYLALDALVGNQEGGLPTGRADDFAIYRGVKDPRFTLIPHDFDTCFDFNTTDGLGNPRDRSIFSFHTGSASLLGLQRLFTHPDLVPVYYQRMLHVVNHVFTRERLDPLIDELLGGWVNDPTLTALRTYIDERRANVLTQIPLTYALTTNLGAGNGSFLQSSTGAVNFTGTFNVAETRSLRLNGQAAVLNYRTLGTAVAGTWSYSASAGSGFLSRGLNRVTAAFYDGPGGTGNVVHRMITDIYVPESGNFTQVPATLSAVTVPEQITLQVPASYVPGVPVLVRVDARTAGGALERAVWNRQAILTAPNGLTLTPSTVPLFNGSGSALVSIGSTVGGNVRTLLPAGGTSGSPLAGAPAWRFLDTGNEPDPAWRSNAGFDDSLWRSGVLQAGAGDGDERTIVNNVNTTTNTRRAYYFRQVFNVESADAITALRIRAVVDDGAVFYLNGTEVHRDNVPAGVLTLNTPASANRGGTEETAIRTFDISAHAALIQPGPNLLAVEVHNFGTGNNDLSLDCALEAVSPVADPGSFTLSANVDGRSAGAALTSLGTTVPQNVSGTLPSGETVWSGLVRITGDLTLPAGSTLRLVAGTVVLIDGNATPGSSAGTDLIINGRLLSEGTAAQPVTLTCSETANRWGELLFNNAAGPSLLQHTLITRGGRSPGRGHTGKGPLVRVAGSDLTLEDCALGDSPAKAFYTTGTSSLTLRRSLIARTITGPELEDGCSLLIEDSNIQEILPLYRESDDPAPDDEDCLYVHNNSGKSIVVRRSVLARCGDDIFDGLGGPLTVEDSILREGWDKGMSLLNNDLTITRTQIVDCDKAIVPKSSTVATRTVTADHVTIISEDHDTTLPPWGYTVAPSNPDPDTASTGFYTQNKSGQSVAGAILAINVSNSLIYAKEPVKVDPLYPAANTVVTWSNLADADDGAALPWPGTGNIALPPLLENQGARLLSPLFASPCRNSGDPAFAADPDGSRTDMGALLALPEDLESGEVRWTRAGSPYRVLENLTVPAGLTLHIDPGVHIQVAANRRITVLGHLLAQGTPQQRILFTGIPGEVAAGDADPIKNGVQSGPPKWGGLRITDSMAQENIVSYVDFIDAQGTSPAGSENYGSVGFIRSWGLVEHCTWAGTHLRMCYGRNSKMTVRHNIFPDMFLFDPLLNRIEAPPDFLAAADNNQEPLKVEYPTTDAEVTGKPNFNNGFPAGGWFRVYYNEFNGNRGHNDVFDADSGRWGVAGQFLLDCRYNHFRGISGDEHIDLGGDAYIASNIFERASKDEWTSDTGYSNAISSGDRGTGTTIMVARNFFLDLDHAINLKANTGTLFEHNTVADFNPDFDYSGTTLGGTPFTQAVKCAAINVFVPEDGSNPTRGDGGYMGYNIFSNLPRLVSGADARISGGNPVNDVTTKLEFGSNLLHQLGTLNLGPNHPGGALNPAYAVPGGGNLEGNPRFNADYSPGPASEAAGRAPGGLDFGATIPEWVYFSTRPESVTTNTSASFTVGGPGLVAFKWRLDGGAWSEVLPIGSGGVFPRTGTTLRQAAVVLTNLGEGPHTFGVLGQDMAGNWQDEDPAIISGPQAAPTVWAWTVTTQPRVQLHEVLAAGNAAPDFIELINQGGTANLAGWRITDAPDKPGYVFPPGSLLAPGLPLLLPAALTGIGLDADGDEVLLYDETGALADRLVFGPQAAGYSLIREGNSWHLGHPTPDAANARALTGDPAGIRISEWFVDSDILFPDDWVELVNPSAFPVALGGLFLSDHAATGAVRYPLPPNSYIGAGGYAVLRLNGQTGGNQMDFALDAEQEALALDYGDVRLDTVVFGPGMRDQSQSRTAAGAPVWAFLPTRGFALPPTEPAYQNAVNVMKFLRITEIMFNPAGGNDYEYLELTNTGTVSLDLAGLRFVEGIDFSFAGPVSLDAGKQTVVVARLSTFQARYGLQVPVAGVYSGRLDNSGETLALALAPPFDGNVLRFRYESTWQASTQGMGRSLQIVAPATEASAYEERTSWQASRVDFGTPGGFTVPPPLSYPAWTDFYSVPGGAGTDEDGDGLISLMEFALRSDPLRNQPGDGADRAPVASGQGNVLSLTLNLPVSETGGGYGAQGITYLFQDSTDLVVWRDLAVKTPAAAGWQFLTNPAATLQQEAAAGGRVSLTLTAPPPAGGGDGQYLRLKTVLSN